MGRGIFGIDFGSAAFVLRRRSIDVYKAIYFRLHERTFQYIAPEDTAVLFGKAKKNHRYRYSFADYDTTKGIVDQPKSANLKTIYFEMSQDNFIKIPGSPLAYWVKKDVIDTFAQKSIGECAVFSYGVFTCNNTRFLRLWFECDPHKIHMSMCDHKTEKWYFLNKGGAMRKWYGNLEYVIDFANNGQEIRAYRKQSGQAEGLPGENYYFQPHVSWSLVSSKSLTFRYYPENMIFDISAPSLFSESINNLFNVLAVLNSKIGSFYLPLFNPTLNNTNSDIKRIPFLLRNADEPFISETVKKNIDIEKMDWDGFETSWNFKRNPLI